MKQAMTGSIQALRAYFALRQEALERVALVAGSQPKNSGKHDDVDNLTDEELLWIANGGLEKMKQKK